MRKKTLRAAIVRCALALPVADPPRKTPLDHYLARPDPTYSWKIIKTIPGDGVTIYLLDLKSQTWRSVPELNRPVWQPWPTITGPDKVTSDTALLSIGAGGNGGEAPTAAPGDAAATPFPRSSSRTEPSRHVTPETCLPKREPPPSPSP
jgi:hypothetical protein